MLIGEVKEDKQSQINLNENKEKECGHSMLRSNNVQFLTLYDLNVKLIFILAYLK